MPTEYEQEQKWRKDSKMFAHALVKHWGCTVTATLGSGAATIFQNLGNTFPATITWIIAMGALVIAAFFAWRDQSDAKQLVEGSKRELENKLETIKSNNITFMIDVHRDGMENYNEGTENEGVKVFSLQLTNLHKTRTAEDVQIWIEKIELEDGCDFTPPFNGYYEIPASPKTLPPGRKVPFIFAYFSFGEETSYHLGLAPFISSKIILGAGGCIGRRKTSHCRRSES